MLRAVDLREPASTVLLAAMRDAGFNAVRPLRDGLVDEAAAAEYGLAVVFDRTAVMAVPAVSDRPFGVTLRAQRSAAQADDAHPASIWGLPAEPLSIAAALARGIRGYSVGALPESWSVLAPLHRWLAECDEELTASVGVQDGLACLDSGGVETLLEGGLAVLALAGYNPALVDLQRATEEELAEFPAALYPCDGRLDLAEYGKLVVLTLRGADLVTYPEPVRCTRDGLAYRTTFLWPVIPATEKVTGRAGQRALGRRVQVRDGVSTLLAEPLGEPYAGPAYYRLPAGQRTAHRDLVVSLFGQTVTRSLEPERNLELELVARLSPDGGALVFVLNRLGAQEGTIGVADIGALNLPADFAVTTLFAESRSVAERRGDTIHVRMASSDVLVLRLG